MGASHIQCHRHYLDAKAIGQPAFNFGQPVTGRIHQMLLGIHKGLREVTQRFERQPVHNVQQIQRFAIQFTREHRGACFGASRHGRHIGADDDSFYG